MAPTAVETPTHLEPVEAPYPAPVDAERVSTQPSRRPIRRALGAVWMLVTLAAAVFLGYCHFSDDAPMTWFRVISGSMEPTITTGSFAFAWQDDDVQVGDVILAPRPSGLDVVHRVIEIDQEAGTFQMQGDANSVADPAAYDIEDAKEVFWVIEDAKEPLRLIEKNPAVTLGVGALAGWMMGYSRRR